MPRKKLSDSQEEKVLGGSGEINGSQEWSCSLGIDHFYDNFVISPEGFKNAEHCSKFLVRAMNPLEFSQEGKSKTGCKFCRYYVKKKA